MTRKRFIGKWPTHRAWRPCELLRGIPRWRRLAALFDVPGMRPLGRVMYASIARNRMKISCAIRPM